MHRAVLKGDAKALATLLQCKLDESAKKHQAMNVQQPDRRIGPNRTIDLPKALLASINEPNDLGMTLLHLACFNNHPDVVSCLLSYGADANIQTSNLSCQPHEFNNWTFPLHMAAQNGSSRIVGMLLEEGEADPYLLDFRGWTAMEVAERSGQEKTAEVIRTFVRERTQGGAGYLNQFQIRHYREGPRGQSQPNLCDPGTASLDIERQKFRSSSETLLRGTTVDLPPGPWDSNDVYNQGGEPTGDLVESLEQKFLRLSGSIVDTLPQ